MNQRRALAIVAHPDDIEFRMAGTLLLLREAGWETHYWTLGNGALGSAAHSAAETVRIRRREAQAGAKLLGAVWHRPLVNDLEIFYDAATLRRVAAVLREVQPAVVLTHPPVDYMEDHTNTCRLVVTAAFAHGMRNFRTRPPRPAFEQEVTLYHGTPHGLRDPLGRGVTPEFFVDTTAVHERKCAALAAHRSQGQWLEASQGMSAHVQAMDDESRRLGRAGARCRQAEGWWRHLHLGFCSPHTDPLRTVLGRRYRRNPNWKP